MINILEFKERIQENKVEKFLVLSQSIKINM